MARFGTRVRPWVAAIIVVALLVPAGRWAADELAFGASRDAVEDALGEDADLADALLRVRSVGCSGRVSTGSAFVLELDAGPTVVTNRHVVEDARNVTVRPLTGGVGAVSVAELRVAAGPDVAVLELEDEAQLPPSLATGGPVRVGDEVRLVGFPGGRPSTGEGEVVEVGPGRLLVDASVSPGASGSPLFDDGGQVVGQVFGTTQEGIGVATPARELALAAATAEPAPTC